MNFTFFRVFKTLLTEIETNVLTKTDEQVEKTYTIKYDFQCKNKTKNFWCLTFILFLFL